MAEKGSLSKQSERAKLNIGSGNGNGKNSNNLKKDLKYTLKNFGFLGATVLVIVLAFGVLIGSMVGYFTSRNDCFELLGADEVTLEVGQTYVDPGVKIVEFGKDISAKVVKSGSFMDLENGTSMEEGSFYIDYSVDATKYSKVWTVHKIRIITFVAASESDVIEPYTLNGSQIFELSVGEAYSEAGINHNKYDNEENVVSTLVDLDSYTVSISELTDEENTNTFLGDDNKVKAEAAGKTFVITYTKEGVFELARTIVIKPAQQTGGEG